MEKLTREEYIKSKQEAKHNAKKLIGKKFKLGALYNLRSKASKVVRTYQLKKIIWAVNDNPINVVIMKQIAGPSSIVFTLNKCDCKQFHIKYEEGLQVFSMTLNWVLKQNERK